MKPIAQNPKETAIRLVNIFTMYGFIKDEDSSDMMVTFAKFAAGQHLLEIINPELSKEDLAFNMQVMKEIRNLEISYPK